MSKKPSPSDTPFDEPTWVFPYAVMSVGDSFFLPTMKPAYMAYIIDTTSKKAGVVMKVFTTTEEGFLGVRAWRIS
jgi:hypothetical protein